MTVSLATRVKEMQAAVARLATAAEAQLVEPGLATQVRAAIAQTNTLLSAVVALEGTDKEEQMTTGCVIALVAAGLVIAGLLVELHSNSSTGTPQQPPQPPPVPEPVTGGPAIACVMVPGTDPSWLKGQPFASYVAALQAFVDSYYAPVWNTPCRLVAASVIPTDHWALVFANDADVANALGYHDVTAQGLPIGKVFVATTLKAGEDVSVTASHELAEMLVDPAINLCASRVKGADSTIYAYETCDAVEEKSFPVGNFQMSDFVLQAYFEDFWPTGTRRDYLGVLPGHDAFELDTGGYAAVFQNGQWTQIFGSSAKRAAFGREDRRDHRNEIRQKIASGHPPIRSTRR